MRQSSIYSLCDPDSGKVRYIGKTVVKPHIRLSQHVHAATKGARNHLHCWIRSLQSRPVIKTLATVPYELDGELERLVIAEYRDAGHDLVNSTDGGEGKKGCFHTEEAKAKIRAWGVGRKMPPISDETRERMAAAQRGKKHTAEHKAKIAAAGVGRKPTEETLTKLRAAAVGRTLPAGAHAKAMDALRARKGIKRGPMSLGQRAKLSAAHAAIGQKTRERMLATWAARRAAKALN